MSNKILRSAIKVLLAAFFLFLPITNFPYFPGNIVGSANVRPLIIYPLFFLLILLTIPTIWKNELPKVWLPFFVFAVIAFISTLLPVIQGESSQLREASIISRSLRGIITLLIAGAIYLTVSSGARKQSDLNFLLKWLYIGLGLNLIWGSLQIVSVLDLFPRWYYHMTHIQKYFTMNVGSPNRIMGLTLEPSWFADQLSALWLPFVLPAVLLDRTIFRKRWGWLTIEKLLLPWLGLVLLFTLSRAGFVVAAIVIVSGLLFFRERKQHTSEKEFSGIWGKIRSLYRNLPNWLRVTLTILVVVILIAAAMFLVSLQSKYIFRMWDYWLNISLQARASGPKSLSGYFRFIGFGPRFIYWETAFRTFLDNPFWGVGIGNFSFHFLDKLPAIQVGYMPEILTRIVPDYSRITTPKNYFARLLAETGILGTAAFVSFLISLGAGGLYLWYSKNKDKKFWGAATLLGLIAFLVDSFSYDSLAIPNPWVVFGLITAAMHVYLVNNKKREKTSE